MSATFRMSAGAIAVALHCLMLGSAVAQNATTKAPADVKPAQSRSDASDPLDQRGTTRSGQAPATTGQPLQSAREQSGRAAQSGQRSTSNFRGEQATGGHGPQEAELFFTNCLLADNKAEVEISELAQQKSENSDVKQFAEQMIKDHNKMIQQLQQVSGSAGKQTGDATSTLQGSDGGRVKTGALGTRSTDATRNSSEQNRPSLPGSSGANNTTGQLGQTRAAGESAAALNGNPPGAQQGGSTAIQQIASIDQQIKERCTQAAKEELQQKSGAEFDKAYIGSAINAHVHAMAALDVIGKQSQGQLAQVAQEAQPTVQQHLDHAKELMKKLDGSGNSGERSADRQIPRSEQ